MSGMRLVMTGDKALKKKLADMEPKVARKAIKDSSKTGTKMIQMAARAIAPVIHIKDKRRRKGALRMAIKTQVLRNRKGSYGTRVNIKFPGETKSNWYYGAWQEYGWVPRPRRSRIQGMQKGPRLGKRVEGKGFMGRASRATGQAAMRVMVAELDKRIQGAF